MKEVGYVAMGLFNNLCSLIDSEWDMEGGLPTQILGGQVDMIKWKTYLRRWSQAKKLAMLAILEQSA